jgi:hypothetical protein
MGLGRVVAGAGFLVTGAGSVARAPRGSAWGAMEEALTRGGAAGVAWAELSGGGAVS